MSVSILALLLAVSAPASPQPATVASPEVQTAVSFDTTSGGLLYTYRIDAGRSPVAAIQLARVPDEATALEPPAGWTRVYNGTLSVQVAERPQNGATTPQMLTLRAHSAHLPGGAHIRLFSGAASPPWDSPLMALERPVIAPVISTSEREPSAAAADILEQVIFRLLIALDRRGPHVQHAWSTLQAAIVALEESDSLRATGLLRSLDHVELEAADASWAREAGQAFRFDLAYVIRLLESAGSDHPLRVTGPLFQETWRLWSYPGFGEPAGTLRELLTPTAVAFVGVLAAVSAELVDDIGEVRTRLTFRPQEVVSGTLSPEERTTVTVWVRGGIAQHIAFGTFADEPVLRPPVETSTQMFVIAERFEKKGSPFDQQLWLKAPDTFTAIVGSTVFGLNGGQDWPQRIVAEERRINTEGARSRTDSEVFLDLLRAARPDVR